jgi:hypothetical protein
MDLMLVSQGTGGASLAMLAAVIGQCGDSAGCQITSSGRLSIE